MKAVVTVVGKDQVGIIAAVCNRLAEYNVNVLDISQTVMHGYFTMMMVVDVTACNVPLAELCQKMEQGQYYLEQLQQHNISMPDFSYGTTFIEVITVNYTGEAISQHEASMEVFNSSLEIIK